VTGTVQGNVHDLGRDVAALFGADGYAESAGNALQEAIKMIGQLRKLGESRKG